MTRRKMIRAMTMALAGLVAPALRGAAGGKAQVHTVTIRGMAFTPAALTVRAGDTVVWTNGDDRDHTVTAADGSFDSGTIRPNGSFSRRFTQAGRFAYSCSLHPRTRGTITVQ